MIDIGAAIRDEREKRHWSQQTLARKMGTVRTYFSKVENGKIVPTLRVLSDIASTFGIEVSELISRAELLGREG